MEVAPSVSTVVNVMTVPSGCADEAAARTVIDIDGAVNVWFAPTGLVPFGRDLDVGVDEGLDRVGPLLGATPSVVTVNGVGVTEQPVQLALPVTLPGVGEVNTIVHWPAASVLGPALSQVLAAASRTAPRRCCW